MEQDDTERKIIMDLLQLIGGIKMTNFLTNDEQLELEKIREKFEVHDLSTLGFALRKIAELQEEIKSVEEYAEAEYQRIDNWLEKANAENKNSIAFFEGLIRLYHERVLLENPKKKTISTPYGSSKSRTKKSDVAVKDKNVLIKHFEDNGMDEYVKYEKGVKWSEFKSKINVVEDDQGIRFFDENGLEIEGLELKEGSTNFSVDINK